VKRAQQFGDRQGSRACENRGAEDMVAQSSV
jgi:hypothetical protein